MVDGAMIDLERDPFLQPLLRKGSEELIPLVAPHIIPYNTNQVKGHFHSLTPKPYMQLTHP